MASNRDDAIDHAQEEDTVVRTKLACSAGSGEIDEDEASLSGYHTSPDNEIPITSMNQLVDKFFGDSGTFRPHYSYAQAKLPPRTSTRPSAPPNDTHVPLLTHDCVLHFLAPHEILALWQTSKYTWISMVPKQRRFILMRSVFGYLRISEEAAQHVDRRIIGGWHAYCPLMIGLCQHLARIYGNFEPDAAHRVYMAHQACFYPTSRSFWRCGSELAEHEVRLARLLDFRDRHMIGYSQPTSKLPPPTMDTLKKDSRVGWGDAEFYCGQETAIKSNCTMMKHQSWMQEHANEAPNSHYRSRLEQGLSPCIWVDQSVSLSRENKLLWALGIGPTRQQFLGGVSATHSDEFCPYSFYHCLEYDPSSSSRNGFIEVVMRRSYSAAVEIEHRDEYSDPSGPTLGILIWFMRRGLRPFADSSIDWKSLIDEVCRPDSEMFRRFYREGLVPWDPFGPHAPRPDPVDHAFVERERQFYIDALISSLFGPADFAKYV